MKGHFSCGCPLRLSWGTVQTMIGQLKSIFQSVVGDKEWNDIASCGNPVDGKRVKLHFKGVKLEQAQSHITQKQAVPIFLGKLQQLTDYFHTQLMDSILSRSQRFLYLRDQAFFKLQFFFLGTEDMIFVSAYRKTLELYMMGVVCYFIRPLARPLG